MTRRTEVLLMVLITGAWGIYFAATRGFWPASPLLVLSGSGALMYVLTTVRTEAADGRGWAVGNLIGVGVALGATWFESPVMLAIGLAFVVVAIVGPRVRGKS